MSGHGAGPTAEEEPIESPSVQVISYNKCYAYYDSMIDTGTTSIPIWSSALQQKNSIKEDVCQEAY